MTPNELQRQLNEGRMSIPCPVGCPNENDHLVRDVTPTGFVLQCGNCGYSFDVAQPRLTMQAVLNEFCDTIDAAGGLVEGIDRSGPVPEADHDWLDLADVYLKACRVLGRRPVVN